MLLVIGPTEDNLPSKSYSSAVRQAQDLRDTGADIYVINTGRRMNINEGKTIATSYRNLRYSNYLAMNKTQDFFTGDILGGKDHKTTFK